MNQADLTEVQNRLAEELPNILTNIYHAFVAEIEDNTKAVGDEAIDLTTSELDELADPVALVGRAPVQADRLLRERVDGLLAAGRPEDLGPPELRV